MKNRISFSIMPALMKFLPAFTMAVVFSLDRITKILIQKNFYYGESRPVLPFFNLNYIENTGAAFGIGQDFNHILIAVSVIILIGLFVYLRKAGKDNPGLKIALALIVGGALGNLYDRIAQGSVTDFLDFYVGTHHWPSFNIADSSILIGVFFLAIQQFNKKTEVQHEKSIS